MTGLPRLEAVATAVPATVLEQTDAREAATLLFSEAMGRDAARLLAVFESTGIRRRHVCMPLEWYSRPHAFGETNALYVEHGEALCARAIADVLAQTGIGPSDVDRIVFVSSTGVANPSLDARLANRLGFRSDVRRTPVWGLGCAGGAAGVALAADLARAHPRQRVLLVTLELCSLTFQYGDRTRQNLVASALFSDGAAAAIVSGADAPALPRTRHAAQAVMGSHCAQLPDSLDVMGWTVDDAGLHVVFSRDIPTIVHEWVRPALDRFLDKQELSIDHVTHIAAHPGGPRVLQAYAGALGCPIERLQASRDVLADHGNMSSPTCLFVLERMLEDDSIRTGDLTLLTALGPGFASEMVLLRAAS